MLPIIAGLILWRYAPFIADKIHPEESAPLNINANEIINAGLFLIGVLIVSLLLIFRSHLLVNLYKQVGNSNE